MIETEQQVEVAAPIAQVWAFAHDIRGWAALMPGLVDCEIVDDDTSRWTLKVGAGALVRTVRVAVRVDRWAGPAEVDFSYELLGDPVTGGGTYRAHALPSGHTAVTFAVRVAGSGPMAPMWEAMGRPLLPTFARAFADQFAAAVAAQGGASAPAPARAARHWLARLLTWFGLAREKAA